MFSPRILESLPPLPRQHSAVIGCTKNYKPIGVTVYTHIALRAYSDVGERGVAMNFEKTQFFHEHPVPVCNDLIEKLLFEGEGSRPRLFNLIIPINILIFIIILITFLYTYIYY